jgi:hypothetical protein
VRRYEGKTRKALVSFTGFIINYVGADLSVV